LHTCKAIAKEAYLERAITLEELVIAFRRRPTIPMEYNEPKMFLEISKK
jgi:hypothetical protein